ncbi:MAG TPA: MBL fold metallo-hydrolase [Acidobacteriota bacterium]|nr:MBL fold metallo-hydrolase [Acidobacteriota bacterium]
MKLTWYGHSTFLIEDGQKIIIDPWQLGDDVPKADIVLITHPHPDHFSLPDIQKVRGQGAQIYAHPGCKGIDGDVEHILPGQKIMVGEVVFDVLPAYNTNKFRSPGVHFHPQDSQFCGFLVQTPHARWYVAGDTDKIPEMDTLKNIDVALLPVSGTYVMTAAEAVDASHTVKAKHAVPAHYGSIVGTKEDGEFFVNNCFGKGVLLKKGEPYQF